MEHNCRFCVFFSSNIKECDFGDGKIKKPESIVKNSNFNMTECPFFLRKSYYDRMPQEDKITRLKEVKERAKKYYS